MLQGASMEEEDDGPEICFGIIGNNGRSAVPFRPAVLFHGEPRRRAIGRVPVMGPSRKED